MSHIMHVCMYDQAYSALELSRFTSQIILVKLYILTGVKNWYQCVKVPNQYATVFHYANPLSPLLNRWLVKKNKEKIKKKTCLPVIICAIKSAGYVPVERLQMAS